MTAASAVHPWEKHAKTRSTALQVEPGAMTPPRVESVLAAGRMAEELGFDAFLAADHPSWQSEPWLHLAALAASTDRIGLGTMVTSVLYRPPVLTARLAADLDHLSNGRLVLGLGIGWDAAALGWGTERVRPHGIALPDHASDRRLAEAIAIIRGVWGPKPFSFQGRHFTVKDAQVVPPPLQGVPTIVIAGAGERTLRQVAELADACNIGPVVTGGVDTLEQARHKLDVLRRHCEAVGRPYEHILRSHFTIWLILAEDEASVRRKVDRYFPMGSTASGKVRHRGYAGSSCPVLPVVCRRGYAVLHHPGARCARRGNVPSPGPGGHAANPARVDGRNRLVGRRGIPADRIGESARRFNRFQHAAERVDGVEVGVGSVTIDTEAAPGLDDLVPQCLHLGDRRLDVVDKIPEVVQPLPVHVEVLGIDIRLITRLDELEIEAAGVGRRELDGGALWLPRKSSR